VCAALLFSAFLVPSALQPRDAVVLIDVGQGDSLLVRSGGQTLLIDTGNQDAKLKAYLAENRIAHLDSILITHADDDHCGSLDVVRSCTECERVLVAADMKGCADDSCTALMEESKATAREVVGLNRGDRFRVGSCEFEVIWPQRFADNGGNADSLCVSMSYDGDGDGQSDVVALFTGDAEHDQLAQMERDGVIGDVDILKVGHHGSRNGMTTDDVALLKPEIALIGVGANNRYGHPTQEILDMLADVGCEVLRTDQDGTVVCELTPLGVHVRN
jgi:competence protein ComEC